MLSTSPAAARATFAGVSALQAAAPATRGHLVATRAGERTNLDIWLTRGAQTVRQYDEDMTKTIHLVVIAADFSSFQHLHPELHPSGHFTISVGTPRAGIYEVYADTVPHGDPQTVFRFAVPLGGETPHGSFSPPIPTGRTATAGAYRVTLDTTTVKAGAESPIAVHIAKGEKPARDLHAYLGAGAHVVLIDTATLAYVHVHPETPGGHHSETRPHDGAMPGMPGMSMGSEPILAPGADVAPDLILHARVATRGAYRMWVQFRGGNALEVAPFSLNAR